MTNRTSCLPPLLLLALALAGCSGLLSGGQPPRQVYLLQPLAVTADTAASGAVLRFALTVVPGLDSDRIQALDPDARLVPYANARWPDHLPEVLHSALRRSLESTGDFERIADGGPAAAGDWRLELEVQAFYGTLDRNGETVSARAVLAGRIDCGGRTADLDLGETAPIGGQRLSAVVAGHQAALDGVTRQLLDAIDRRCGLS